eukprot:4240738-Alexandrium_andersonii.AAC.1
MTCRAADFTLSSSAPATNGRTMNRGTRQRGTGPAGTGATSPRAGGGKREQKCPSTEPPAQGAR